MIFPTTRPKTHPRIPRAIAVVAGCVLLAGCTQKAIEARYYLIEFTSSVANQALKLAQPLPYSVQVLTLKTPRAYDTMRIIARYSSHQINYKRYSLWAVRPQVAAADLLVQQINAYHLFKDCQREFLDKSPDYEIDGDVTMVELFESENYSAAHLNMELDLYDYNNKNILVRHNFDRQLVLPPGDMTIFAKAISDIFQGESEVFLTKVVQHFQSADSLKAEVSPKSTTRVK